MIRTDNQPCCDSQRAAAAEIVTRIVCRSFCVNRDELLSRTRQRRQVALARQVALYLLHTAFGQAYTDVGRLFGRERTTVAYACAAIEDERDDISFDMKVETLEDCAERLWAIESLRGGRPLTGGLGSQAAA